MLIIIMLNVLFIAVFIKEMSLKVQQKDYKHQVLHIKRQNGHKNGDNKDGFKQADCQK